MRDLSLHILDVVENSIRANARRVEILVEEDEVADLLRLEIADDGNGMDESMMKQATDPFVTSKPGKRVGLGLALLEQATKEADGEFELESEGGAGTRIRATFRHAHPDRKPLGDIPATLETLVAGNPGVEFLYEYRRGAETITFDTRGITQP